MIIFQFPVPLNSLDCGIKFWIRWIRVSLSAPSSPLGFLKISKSKEEEEGRDFLARIHKIQYTRPPWPALCCLLVNLFVLQHQQKETLYPTFEFLDRLKL